LPSSKLIWCTVASQWKSEWPGLPKPDARVHLRIRARAGGFQPIWVSLSLISVASTHSFCLFMLSEDCYCPNLDLTLSQAHLPSVSHSHRSGHAVILHKNLLRWQMEWVVTAIVFRALWGICMEILCGRKCKLLWDVLVDLCVPKAYKCHGIPVQNLLT
jgi:hypothetical protein